MGIFSFIRKHAIVSYQEEIKIIDDERKEYILKVDPSSRIEKGDKNRKQISFKYELYGPEGLEGSGSIKVIFYPERLSRREAEEELIKHVTEALKRDIQKNEDMTSRGYIHTIA